MTASSSRPCGSPMAPSRPSAASTSRSRRARPSPCSAPTAPASRRPSTCCSGLPRPTPATVSLFGLPPAEAVAAGRVGGMLQTGALIDDLTVRELVTMVASLYPHPLDVDEVLAHDRHRRLRRPAHRRSSPAARPSGSASPSPWSPTPTCSCSTSRPSPSTSRAGATSGRPCAPLPRSGQDGRCSPPTTSRRPTPTPTASCSWPAGGSSPTGPPTEIKARVGGGRSGPRSPASTLADLARAARA